MAPWWLFRTTREVIVERSFFEVARDGASMKELRTALEGILPKRAGLTDYDVRIDLPGLGSKRLIVNARQLVSGTRSYPLILLSLHAAG